MKARAICLLLLTQAIVLALALALAKAGSSIAARMAMMAITTSSSINVKPLLNELLIFIFPPLLIGKPASRRQLGSFKVNNIHFFHQQSDKSANAHIRQDYQVNNKKYYKPKIMST